MGDAIDERPRLSGTGAGDDEERTIAKRRCRRLFGVELGGEVPRTTVDRRCPFRVGSTLVDSRFRHSRNIRASAHRAGVFSAPLGAFDCHGGLCDAPLKGR